MIVSARSQRVWLIDIVDAQKVMDALEPGQTIAGVFITHAHYDHIHGINALTEHFPDCVAYVSEHGKEGLYCEKTNLSHYHNDPIVYTGSNFQVLADGDTVILHDDCVLEVMHTPGHNPGCLTYKVGPYLFTGDAFIPGIKVVTKLKSGNRKDNETSLTKIHSLIREDTIICPGHGKYGRLTDFE